jgi:ABC-type multidrug transport system fused ATPase/permease subunit
VTVSRGDRRRVAAVAVSRFGHLSPSVSNDVSIHDNRFEARGGAHAVRVTGTHPGLLFDDNRYSARPRPLLIGWRGETYRSVPAWRAATGQEPLGDSDESGAGAPSRQDPLLWLVIGALALMALALVRRAFRRAAPAVAAAAAAPPKPEPAKAKKPAPGKKSKPGRELWLETVPQILPYAKPYWKLLVGSILMTILAAALTIAQPWPIALVIDDVLGGANGKGAGFLSGIGHAIAGDGQSALLIFAIVSVFMIATLEGGAQLLGTYITTRLKLGMVLDFMSDLFQHFQRLGLTFHDKTEKGQLIARVNQSPSSLGEFVGSAAPIVQNMLTLIGMFAIAFLIDWQVALAALAILPLLYYQIGLYNSRVIPDLRHTGRLEMRVMSTTLEAMQMLRLIVSFGRERQAHEKFVGEAETANEARMRVTVKQTLFSLGVSAATAAGTAIVLYMGAKHVMSGRISVGELVILITYISAVYKPLQDLMSTLGMLNEQLVGLTFALEVLAEKPEIVERPNARTLERAEGRMTFENVSFSYKERQNTLTDISFEAEPGRRVAVVGQTGSGKSTLASLMIRFYDPDTGRVLVDGIDARDLKLNSLRDQISVVLQDPLLMAGTIGDNIRFGRLDATEEDIVAAAKAANVHEFISGLKNGYKTKLGERGAQLSGGERQRICVARAFLKDAPILILDEPTSSIDSKTEGVIFDALEDLMVDRTSFVITHRLSTIRESDLILVMQEGRIVASGTHEELYEESELYRSLYGVRAERARRTGSDPLESLGAALGANVDALAADSLPAPIEEPEPEPEPANGSALPPLAPTGGNGSNGHGHADDDGKASPEANPDDAQPKPVNLLPGTTEERWRAVRERVRRAVASSGRDRQE